MFYKTKALRSTTSKSYWEKSTRNYSRCRKTVSKCYLVKKTWAMWQWRTFATWPFRTHWVKRVKFPVWSVYTFGCIWLYGLVEFYLLSSIFYLFISKVLNRFWTFAVRRHCSKRNRFASTCSRNARQWKFTWIRMWNL